MDIEIGKIILTNLVSMLISLIVGFVYKKKFSLKLLVNVFKHWPIVVYAVIVSIMTWIDIVAYQKQKREAMQREDRAQDNADKANRDLDTLKIRFSDLEAAVRNEGYNYDQKNKILIGGNSQVGVTMGDHNNNIDMREMDINLSREVYRLKHVYTLKEQEILSTIRNAERAFFVTSKTINLVLVKATDASMIYPELDLILKRNGYSIGNVDIAYSVPLELRKGIAANINIHKEIVLYVGHLDEPSAVVE